MGSTLATGVSSASRFLWSDDFRANYATLMESPGCLRWSGVRASPKLLNRVVFSVPFLGFPLRKFELWSRTLDWISACNHFDGRRLIQYGYDWRAPLEETAALFASDLGEAVDNDVSNLRTPQTPDFVFFAHSMGGLLVQLALGSGQLHPSWVGALVFIGTPHKGSPSAFRSAYGSLSLPLFQDIFACIKRRNRLAFFSHLLECIRTFPSIYSLFPPEEVLYLYYSASSRSNPLTEGVMPRENVEIARRTHQLVKEATRVITKNSIRSYTVYTAVNANRLTELEYRVTPLQREQAYQILEPISTTMRGDGTVPAESAMGNIPPLVAMTVTNVTHDTMCNSPMTVACLDALFAEVGKDDSSLQYR
jgi:pimeloyl-ACP methyl ester carboxylesterase